MQKLIPKGWYTATITQAYKTEDNKLRICFTVDGGEFAYRHVLRDYPINDFGKEKLENHFWEIGRFVFTDEDYPLFTQQFPNLRCEIHIDRARAGDVIENFILEMKKTTKEPEYDVTREKTEEHFHKENKGRKLPICKQGTIKKKQFKR